MKKTIITALLSGSIAFGTCQLSYAAPKIISSIYPVQQIANAIAGEHTELVTDSYLSPHQYTIKPRDAQEVLSADLFIWINPMIVPQLDQFVDKRIASKKAVLTIGELPGMKLLPVSEPPQQDHIEQEHHGHEHCGHDHSGMSYDPHVWLSTDNAKVIATAITHELSEMDPENSTMYANNLAVFITGVDATKAAIRTELATHKPRPFFIFHDAYKYFEHEFGVKHQGVIRAHAGQTPKTQHLAQLQKQLRATPNACLFREPQFQSQIVKQLVSGSGVTEAVLDPLGYKKTDDFVPNGYNKIIETIAHQLATCGK